VNVSIVRPAERELEPVKPESPVQLRVVTDGLEGEPYVHLTEVPAGHHIATHSHSETEVTIILFRLGQGRRWRRVPGRNRDRDPGQPELRARRGRRAVGVRRRPARKAAYDGPK